MSILSAIKSQTGTLTELSKLPQALIMQMAQKGQIAQEMVMPILSKKAEMVEAARAMQNAQQQGGMPPTTVLEQIMQQNAVAEQPAPQPMQQSMPQREQGIETLDTGRMNPEQYAGGGIVAFDEGGEVPSYAGGSFIISPSAQRERDFGSGGRRDILLQELQTEQARANAGDAAAQQNVIMLQRELSRMKPAPSMIKRGLSAAADMLIPNAAAGERSGYVEDPMQQAPMRGQPREIPPVAPPPKPVGIATVKPAAPPAPAAPPVVFTPPPVPKEERLLPPVEVFPEKETPPELVAPVFKPEILSGRGFDIAQDKARAEEFTTAYGIDPDYFKKQRDKLEAESAEIPKEKEQAKYMALAEAGLAIAAGASPYALQNIAKGGGKGLEAYKGYQKDIKEKQRLLKDRDAKISEAEQLEKRGQMSAAMVRRDKAMEHDDRLAELNAKSMAEAEKNNLQATFSVQKTLWDRYNLTEDQQVLANREILVQGARDKAAMERIVAQVAGNKEIAAMGVDKVNVIPAKDMAKLRMEVEQTYGPAIKKALVATNGSNTVGTPAFENAYRIALDKKIAELSGQVGAKASASNSGFKLLPD